MTVAGCVQAQNADPTINQVVTVMKNKMLEIEKVAKEMPHGLKHFLKQRGKLCL